MAGERRTNLLSRLTATNLILVLVLCLVETAVAERYWLTALLAYAPQQPFAVPTFILLLWSLARRKGWLIAWNALAAAMVIFVLLGFNVPGLRRGDPGGETVSVMTYNIHYALSGPETIARAVRSLDPDIICLQEAHTGHWRSEIVPELPPLLSEWHMAGFRELATFSRYPILSQRVHRLQPKTGRAVLETVLDVDGRRVTVLNVHLNTAATHRSLFRNAGGLPAYMRHTADVRSDQVSALLRIADGIETPVVVAGDFNTPPRGRLYRRMSDRFRDAFGTAGWGLGYTYRRNLPVMRIDYIFAGYGVKVKHCRAPKVNASDHRPVLAELGF